MFKTLLINPPVWTYSTPPLSISYLAAMGRKHGFDISCIDLNIELFSKMRREKRYWLVEYESYWGEPIYKLKINNFFFKIFINSFIKKIEKFKPKLIGFPLNSSPPIILQIVKKIKEKNKDIKVIVGGTAADPSSFGSSILQSRLIDCLVLGEGELTFLEILHKTLNKKKINEIKGIAYLNHKNQIVITERRERILNFDEIPFPDFSDYNFNSYMLEDFSKKSFKIPVQFSRGRINNCDFCTTNHVWGKPYICRSPENMLDEIKSHIDNYKINNFIFSDMAINGDLIKLEKFCDLIIANNIKISWSGLAIIRKDMDNKLLNKMRLAGCCNLTFGMESGSNNVLKAMGKGYSREDIIRLSRDLASSKISFGFTIIVGHPAEKRENFLETLSCLFEIRDYLKGTTPGITPCQIIPNTLLFKKYQNEYGFNNDTWKWKIGENSFDERIKRIKEINRFIKENIDSRGARIPERYKL